MNEEALTAYIFWALVGGTIGALAADRRGFSTAAGIVGGMLLGLFAFLLFLVSGESKTCPFCAERVQLKAVVCKHCRRDLPVSAATMGATADRTPTGGVPAWALVAGALVALVAVGAVIQLAQTNVATGPPAPAFSDTSPEVPPTSSGRPLELTAGESMTMVLTAISECWVSLTVDGSVRVSRLMAPGERETHEIREGAVLQLGDAAAVKFTINGRPSRPLGPAGSVETVRITRSNVSEYLQ